MKKICTILLVALLSVNIFAQTPNWGWVRSAGLSSYDDEVKSVATDKNGCSYAIGNFLNSTITFGTTTLTNTSTGGHSDIFIVKYDTNGNVLWAKDVGGTRNDYGNSITVDSSGNCYVTGYFQSANIVFDTITLVNPTFGGTYLSMFTAKYDTNGNVVWAKRTVASNQNGGFSIAVDNNGNCYVTGYFTTTTISFGAITLAGSGVTDFMIVKYDTNGNAVWARTSSLTNNTFAYAIALDGNGNVFVTGIYIGSGVIFGSIPFINAGQHDIFVAKYDTNGNFLWARSAGGNDYDEGYIIATDGNGNCYAGGEFSSSSITFGTTTLTNTGSVGYGHMYLVKYDSAGNVLWAKTGIGDCKASAITVEQNGNVYFAGRDNSSSTINFGNITLSFSGYLPQMFVVKYDSSGTDLWGITTTGTTGIRPFGISQSKGNLYVAGTFGSSSVVAGNIHFGPSTIYNSGGAAHDLFIAKIDSTQLTLGNSELYKSIDGINIYPNPTSGDFTIVLPTDNVTVIITDILGKQILKTQATQTAINIELENNGVYFVYVATTQGTTARKLIVNR